MPHHAIVVLDELRIVQQDVLVAALGAAGDEGHGGGLLQVGAVVAQEVLEARGQVIFQLLEGPTPFVLRNLLPTRHRHRRGEALVALQHRVGLDGPLGVEVRRGDLVEKNLAQPRADHGALALCSPRQCVQLLQEVDAESAQLRAIRGG